MAVNGRRKGNVAEREIAKLLQEWWSKVEPDCQFVRTPLSGGWSSAKVRGDFRASGDIMTTAKQFPFVVEAKRREQWSMDSFEKGNRSPVWRWWKQSQKQADEANGLPMLWIRKNHVEWFVVVGKEAFVQLHGHEFIGCMVRIDQELVACVRAKDLFDVNPHRFSGVHLVNDVVRVVQ